MKGFNILIIMLLLASLSCRNQITRPHVEATTTIQDATVTIKSDGAHLYYDPSLDAIFNVWIDYDNILQKELASDHDVMKNPRVMHALARTAQNRCAMQNTEGMVVVWPIEYVCITLANAVIPTDPDFDYMALLPEGIIIKLYYGESKTYCIPFGQGCRYKEIRYVLGASNLYEIQYQDFNDIGADIKMLLSDALTSCSASPNLDEISVGPVFFDCASIIGHTVPNGVVFRDHGITVTLTKDDKKKSYYVTQHDPDAPSFVEYVMQWNSGAQNYELYWKYDTFVESYWLNEIPNAQLQCAKGTSTEVTIHGVITFDCYSVQ